MVRDSSAPEGLALVLNPRTLQVIGPAGPVDVSDAECCLLNAFMAAPGARCAIAALLNALQRPADEEGLAKRSLEVMIVRLRKKLVAAGAAEPTIKSIRGYGYQLCVGLALPPSSSARMPAWNISHA